MSKVIPSASSCFLLFDYKASHHTGGRSYLQPGQLELEILFLIKELLKPVREDYVGIVQAAVFFVELVVLIGRPRGCRPTRGRIPSLCRLVILDLLISSGGC